jgi:dTDP-4-amino-4,6-dideoxygalactose transaminase
MALSNAYKCHDDGSHIEEAENKISLKTSHNHVKLVNSGNSAILACLNSINSLILIPDQGGWHGFRQMAKFLNKEFMEFKTNRGLINVDYLDDAIKNLDENSYPKGAILLTSFAGYTAEQPIKEISKFADENDLLLIEDASGGILDNKKRLGNGKYSDVILCSTGSPKIINLGYGGFISTNNQEIFEESKLLLKTFSLNSQMAKGLITEVDHGERYFKIATKSCKYLKKNLKSVIHEDKRGINIVISTDEAKKLAINLRSKFNINGSFITKCPNYNRIKEKAVAVEIKNLNPQDLGRENLDHIIETILDLI